MLTKVKEIASQYKGRKDMLIQVLKDIQPLVNNTLSMEVAKTVANAMEIPLAEVYDTATFYAIFSTKERGKHVVRVCRSAPCHVKGAPKLLDEISKELGVKCGETTKDGLFTLETCECLGVCDLSPVVMIDDDVYGKVDSNKLKDIFNKYR